MLCVSIKNAKHTTIWLCKISHCLYGGGISTDEKFSFLMLLYSKFCWKRGKTCVGMFYFFLAKRFTKMDTTVSTICQQKKNCQGKVWENISHTITQLNLRIAKMVEMCNCYDSIRSTFKVLFKGENIICEKCILLFTKGMQNLYHILESVVYLVKYFFWWKTFFAETLEIHFFICLFLSSSLFVHKITFSM